MHARQFLTAAVVPTAAFAGAVFIFALLLRAVGRDPVAIFGAIARDGFGSTGALSETLVRMTPLLLCALAAAIPARGGLLNIGAEGQLHVGAVACTAVVVSAPWLPPWSVLPTMFLAAMLGAAAWGAIPGMLRGWFGVSEVLVSLMLNFVGILLVQHLVHGVWRDPDARGWPYTIRFPDWATLPTFADSKIHLGLALGILASILLYFALRRTTWGFGARIIEANPTTARYVGIPVPVYLVGMMALGGAFAGIAGLGEVSVVQGRLRPDISPGYGYTGFLVAWLARHHFVWILPLSFLVAGLYTGADALQISAALPSATVDIFMGTVFLAFIIGAYSSRRS